MGKRLLVHFYTFYVIYFKNQASISRWPPVASEANAIIRSIQLRALFLPEIHGDSSIGRLESSG